MSAAPKRVVVLAEPESLFLPNCLARLAREHPIAAIVEVPATPLRVALRRSLTSFGAGVTAAVAAAEILARIVDTLAPDRFYSLAKLARRLEIPYERVSDLHAPDCIDAIRRHDPDVVFAQVGRRIRPELLALVPFWNKHCSLLPSYAGVFPVFWTLLERGDAGVTIHVMDEEFDRGPILQQRASASRARSFFALYHELYAEVPALLVHALRGEVAAPARKTEPSYRGFPTRDDRREFRRRGLRFGFPFRLHARIRLVPQALPQRLARSGCPSIGAASTRS